MPIGVGAGLLISAAIGGGTAVAGGVIQSKANNKALSVQDKSAADALAFEKDNEQRRRLEYDQTQAQQRAQWDAEQARKAPYREMGDAILRRRAERLGIPFSPRPAPTYSGGAATTPQTLGSLAQSTPAVAPLTPGATSLGNLARFRYGRY